MASRALAPLLAALALASCGFGLPELPQLRPAGDVPAPHPIAAAPLSASQRRLVADTVGRDLKLPDEALYRWPPRADRTIYCGLVDAPDAAGAYVGYQVFQVALLEPTLSGDFGKVSLVGVASPEEAGSDLAYKTVCGRYGYRGLAALQAQP